MQPPGHKGFQTLDAPDCLDNSNVQGFPAVDQGHDYISYICRSLPESSLAWAGGWSCCSGFT